MTISRPRRTLAAASVLLVLGTIAGQAPVSADVNDDPNLEQSIDPDQDVVTDEVVLESGHVDLGPRFDGGEWTLMVHDDTALEGSVWRRLDRTVLRLLDAARLTVPDDEAYSFLGVEPGAEVHVVPQTQNAETIWLGWNTQDPQVMDRIDRGVTLTMNHVTGPGELVVYLQSGGFGEPDVLWDSRQEGDQDIWVDVNTHTHANWVFSEPGVYLVEVTASADLIDGTTVSDREVLRFAVGTATATADALTAEPDDVPVSGDAEPSGEEDQSESGGALLLWIAIGAAVLLALATAMLVTMLRARRAKQRAMSSSGDER
ncbi:choice-of-anchor M domain-containing protein [uncultured Aeromicrobium sp.]|uniref:choice-of-anchor M domain-containing protein n=1 Tax=uncultured Aeromicrobium sp. TaxID=337820 RepID=UPI0025E6C3B3|nr:choice-of-anchor M domain-containing protein [uncultured Aeromicrobium sp.]